MNFIDTADVYGHDPANFSVGRGRSEEIIGAALREANARELLPMAQSYGLAVLPWSPTAGGFLAGAYRQGEPPPPGSRYAEFWRGEAERYTEAAYAVLAELQALSSEKGCTTAQLALAWCAGQPGVTSPIIGPRTAAQLADALGALGVAISADDRARLDAVAPPGRASVPYYGTDGFAWTSWGPHTQRW